MAFIKVSVFVALFCIIQVIADESNDWNESNDQWSLKNGMKDSEIDEVAVNAGFPNRDAYENLRIPNDLHVAPFGPVNLIQRYRRQIAPINPDKRFTLNLNQATPFQGAGSLRLWESPNQRHQIHAVASYGQGFTPYAVGAGYVFRF